MTKLEFKTKNTPWIKTDILTSIKIKTKPIISSVGQKN